MQQAGSANDSFQLVDSTSDNLSAVVAVSRVREITVQPHRVFINHVDGYHASKLIDVLYDEIFEPPEFEREPINEEDEETFENEGEEEEEDIKRTDEDESSKVTSSKKATSSTSNISGSSIRKKFDIIGTVFDQKIKNIEGVRIIPDVCSNQESFLAEILRCGYIIFDITQDSSQIKIVLWTLNQILIYLEELEKEKPKAFAANPDCRYFILVSNVMTWAKTKPMRGPLTEVHYRKRRAHKNLNKEHIHCERVVYAATKKRPQFQDKLRTAVVCAGITYGAENFLLEYAFKLGYMNEKSLPVILDGDNLVPLLHCRDLAAAVFAIMKEWPRLRYILAVERMTSTQRDIIKAVSRVLTTGKIKNVSKERAREYQDITCKAIDAMTVNLNLQPAFLTRSKFMRWQSELSFVDNVERVVQEFREARNLYPLRLIILGPPASGKSLIARLIARHYRLHFVSLKKLITETLEQLKDQIEEKKVIEEVPEEDDEYEDEDANEHRMEQADKNFEDIVKLENMFDEITTDLTENNGRLKDSTLTKIFQFKLLSKPCRNQGYVIDGYPKTMEQAMMLFAPDNNNDEEDDEEEEDNNVGNSLKEEELMAILPDLVIAFDAEDEFLMNRVLNLAEKNVANSRYSEENMRSRLGFYRQRNAEDNSPLQLFDELEIHPIILNVEDDATPQMISTFQCCLECIGETHDYGKTLEELEEEKRQLREIEAAENAKEAAEQERINAEMRCQKQKQDEQWAYLLERLKIEEEQRLRLMAEPLRHFLCKQVLPIITQGLVQVTKMRPDDPVGYLAEYLIKENPEARLFEPDYTEAASSTLSSIKLLQLEGVLPAFEALGDEAYEHLQSCTTTTTTSDTSSSSDHHQLCQCCWCSGATSSTCYHGESSLDTCTGSHPSITRVYTGSMYESGGSRVTTTSSDSQVWGQSEPSYTRLLEGVEAVDRDKRVDAAKVAEVAEPVNTQDSEARVGDAEEPIST